MNESRLQISDLMVGDLMKVAKNVCVEKGAIVRILGMDSTITLPHKELIGCVLFVRSNDIDEIVHGVYIDAIEPIPLTPEILEKNGFACTQKADEMETAYECWSFHDGLLSIVFEPEVVMLEVHNGGENGGAVRTITYYTDNDIMYLHELQHALRLCKIEKNIEL